MSAVTTATMKRTLSKRFSSMASHLSYSEPQFDAFPARTRTVKARDELFQHNTSFSGLVETQWPGQKLGTLIYPPSQLQLPSLVAPFVVPAESILSSVGRTPITQIDCDVWAKLEGFSTLSGSIKDRAVRNMVMEMFNSGELQNGSTLVLITSGSAGLALSMIQKALAEDCGVDLRTIIVMPKAYEQKVACQKMIEAGVATHYDKADPDASSQLLLLDGIFMDVMKEGKALAAANGFAVLDQHYDLNSMLGHKSTALELLAQMPDVTDVVCATGTGATAAGLRQFLPADVQVHSRASESGAIDGLSDINRYDNFCDASQLANYREGKFDKETAIAHQSELLADHELSCGMSTGATMWLARGVKAKADAEGRKAKVAFISACGRPL